MLELKRVVRLLVTCVALLAGPMAGAGDCILGESYYNQAKETGSPEQRLFHLEQAIAECPTFAAWYWVGRTQLALGRPAAALAAYHEARRIADGRRYEGLALGRTAEVYLVEGRMAEAVAAVEGAVEHIGDELPTWLVELRRQLDIELEGETLAARSIAQILSSTRSFGVTPRVQIRVQFAYDSAVLDARARRQVAELGEALMGFRNEGYRIQVIGHTDKQGSEDYNLTLSQKRARAVVGTLARGFPALAGSLAALGKGESQPLYPGDSEQDYRLNRRVEVRLVK